MSTPADVTDLWLQSASGPLSMLCGLSLMIGIVFMGVSFLKRAGRAM